MIGSPAALQWLRALLPLSTALIAVAIDLAPRPAPGGGGISPCLTLGVVFFWSIYRPDLLNAPATFAVGLVYDICAGQPLGLTALVLLLVQRVLVVHQSFVLARPFLVVWGVAVLLVPIACLLRYTLSVLWFGMVADPFPIFAEAILTIAWYPPLAWILVRIHGQLIPLRRAEP